MHTSDALENLRTCITYYKTSRYRPCGSLNADSKSNMMLIWRSVSDIWNFQVAAGRHLGFGATRSRTIRSSGTTRSRDIVTWNFQEHFVKYPLIPARTAGDEAFWKYGQTDRATERQTHGETCHKARESTTGYAKGRRCVFTSLQWFSPRAHQQS